jgi:hypothetical protein
MVYCVVHKAPTDDSNDQNSVANRVETFDDQLDPAEAADPYAQYRTLQSDAPLTLYASNGKVDLPTVQLLRDMGEAGDANSDALFQLASLDRFDHLSLANPADRQIDGLARAFDMTPAQTREFLRRAELQFAAEGLKALTEPISKEEQQKRLAEASQEVSQALGKINTGSANAGDLAELLNSYSKLGGFPQGALAQGAVGQMMDRVRSVLAAVAEGKALGNFDYASIIHNRRTRADMQHEFENKRLRTQHDV